MDITPEDKQFYLMVRGRMVCLTDSGWTLINSHADATPFATRDAAASALAALPPGPEAHNHAEIIPARLAHYLTRRRSEPPMNTTPDTHIDCLLCVLPATWSSVDIVAAITHVQEAHDHSVYGQHGGWRERGHADGAAFFVDTDYLYVNNTPVLRRAVVTARAAHDLFRTLGTETTAPC